MATDKQEKVLKVPTLRFPEFTEKWHRTTFGECCSPLEYGMNAPAKVYDGKNKYIRITDIDEDTSSYRQDDMVSPDGTLEEKYLVKENDILWARTGASTGKAYLYNAKDGLMYYAGFLIRGNVKPEYNSKFVFLQTQTQKYRRWVDVMSIRSGQPGINSQEYSSYKFNLPFSRDEQDKVSAFFSLLDERIATQIRIIEDLRNLKAYIHNIVFSKENTLFGQRNTIRLSDIATKITRKNKGNTINNVLSNSAAMGIVPQAEVFDKEIANEDNTANYYVIGNGDFVYNPRKSAQAPFGPINMYKEQAEGIISPLYLCFQVKGINKNYLLHYFMSNVWYSYIYSNGDTGVRHDRVSIKDETFLDMPLYLHTIDKQQEIAKMMDQVDAKIALEELYHAKLQRQKDYLLTAMFV